MGSFLTVADLQHSQWQANRPTSIYRTSWGGDRRPVYDVAWAALRSQCGFTRNNDAGGEIKRRAFRQTGDHEPGNQDSEHNIIDGCHTITAQKESRPLRRP
jgi:hypothetical protein